MDSSDALKFGAAVVIGLVVFAIFIAFAGGPARADKKVQEVGGHVLDYVQNTSMKIMNYTDDKLATDE